jgi:DNA polymerase III delta' subunit
MIVHQKQWQFLRKTAELGKTPHALLFYGPDSIGKRTLALEFIKLLNCQSPDFRKRPCGICRSCQDIEKKVHPDLFIVEPQENKEIKIAQIRDLNTNLVLKSYSAPYKAAIIDQAHCLNQEAQSAFLKILEEPKGKTIFILISQYPEMMLPTILSRVERLRFYSVPAKTRHSEFQKKVIAEILKMSGQDLNSRFQYAKELAEKTQNLKEILDVWLSYFREALLAGVNGKSKGYPLAKLKRILKTIQTTNFLISTTNVNPRLALEILMLEL